jgi:hypothetical protein
VSDPTSRLCLLESRPGRVPGERRVVIAGPDGRPAAAGLWCEGRPAEGVRPWADVVVEDDAVLPDLAAAVGAGGSVMVAYGRDTTEGALRRKVPPAATPLGLALLRAGCRWFKDWYFPEGGREGGTKLQGTMPLDDGRRRDAEAELLAELSAFLTRGDARSEDRRRAGDAVALLTGDTAEVPTSAPSPRDFRP